jgi:hypothetical protein
MALVKEYHSRRRYYIRELQNQSRRRHRRQRQLLPLLFSAS